MPNTQYSKVQSHVEFIHSACEAAAKAGHPYPDYAACEAALESSFGTSGLAMLHKNLFGMKQHKFPVYKTVMMPTWEEVNGQKIRTEAPFVEYPDWTACFADQLNTLRHVSVYHDAWDAKNGAEWIRTVSAHWATDHLRAAKILNIYEQFYGKGTQVVA